VSAPYTYPDENVDARRTVQSLDGLYVGQLDAEEMLAFNIGIREGFACREFRGAGGLLGLAKVRYIGGLT